ncbi:MAG: DUF1569 domain-containing protein [Chitinophagaceae bacterium]
MPSLFEPQTAQEIIERINKLQATSQRCWGKMSVAQMLEHCNHALGTATGDVTVNVPFLFKFIGPLIKKTVMEAKPYKQSLPTAKEFIITNEKDFEKEKASVLARINKLLSNGESKVDGLKHPVFGKMTAYEWGFSQWKHFDHHLRQFGV